MDFSKVKTIDELNRVLPGVACNLSNIGPGAYVGYPAGRIETEFGVDSLLLPRIVGSNSVHGPTVIPDSIPAKTRRVLQDLVRACHTVLLNSIR